MAAKSRPTNISNLVMKPEDAAAVKRIKKWMPIGVLVVVVMICVVIPIYQIVAKKYDAMNVATKAVSFDPVKVPQREKVLYEYADSGNVLSLLEETCQSASIRKALADKFMLNPAIIKALSLVEETGDKHKGCYAIKTSSEEVLFAVEGDNQVGSRLDLAYFTEVSAADRFERRVLENESKKAMASEPVTTEKLLNMFKPPEDGKVHTPQIAYAGRQVNPFMEMGHSLEPVTNPDQTVQLRTKDGKRIWTVLTVTPDVACAAQNRQLAAELGRKHGLDFGAAKYAESEVFALDNGSVRHLRTLPGCYVRSSEGKVQIFWLEASATASADQFRTTWNLSLLGN